MGLTIQEKLFDIKTLEIDSKYITPSEKRKWTISFTKWCNEQYAKLGSQKGLFCCGCMNICDFCKMEKCNGCADCVQTIKEWYIKNKGVIPYRNYNFEIILKEVENNE